MQFYIGVTDNDWFKFLAKLQPDEVNFWLPSTKQPFRALSFGGLFLFKLHAPLNYIVGGGYFVAYSKMPVSIAWRAFAEKNGVSSESTLRQAINYYRSRNKIFESDPEIGNVILTRPFFFERVDWIAQPEDWSPNIVRGKGYDSNELIGARLWEQAMVRVQKMTEFSSARLSGGTSRFGKDQTISPRLGQGAFRILVTDAYDRRCAITTERTLPVLEAAHIKPFSESGPNSTNNGLLLRADLHILFDRGYLTVTNNQRVEVSKRIKEEYENGRDYYAMHGKGMRLPSQPYDRPSSEFLNWHNQNVFLG